MKWWYKVYLANPEMSELKVYRTFWDRWFSFDNPNFMIFRTDDGKVVRIAKHWIIKIEAM